MEKAPGVCGGRARVRATRITVWQLVEMQQHGLSDAKILAGYPDSLTQEDLDAAWQYPGRSCRSIATQSRGRLIINDIVANGAMNELRKLYRDRSTPDPN